MRDVAGVTLLCVDTANHALALRALAVSGAELRFEQTLFLTDSIPAHLDVPPGISVIPIRRLASRDEYSRFVLKSLLAHVTTPHVLLIQWDGYVVNPAAFEPAFLDCDYIGAKWFWFDDGMRVGNGGFSLRSRKLLEALQDPRIELVEAEDVTIGRAFRPLLEREYGIRYADDAMADRFAFEAAYPTGQAIRLSRPLQLLPCRCAGRACDARADVLRRDRTIAATRSAIAKLYRAGSVGGSGRDREAKARGGARGRRSALAAHACRNGIGERSVGGPQRPVSLRQRQALQAVSRDLGHRGFERSYGHGSSAQRAATVVAGPVCAGARAARRCRASAGRHRRSRARVPRSAARGGRSPARAALPWRRAVSAGRFTEALPLLQQSAGRVPAEPEFHNNLGLGLAALDRNDEAIAAYRATLSLKPAHATASNNLGLALQAMNRVPEAIAAYRHALSVTPAFAHAHWNLALALLANGECAEGWREYEWRLRLPELGGRAPALPFARWDGGDLRDRTLLLIAEQGIGDAIQFVRFAADVAARARMSSCKRPQRLLRCCQPSRAWPKRCQPARPRRPCDAGASAAVARRAARRSPR
jgi:Flp pilus assembly protein TadD